MKSMQRKFGKLTKRQADEGDVGVVLAEFKAMDEMLDTVNPSPHQPTQPYRRPC